MGEPQQTPHHTWETEAGRQQPSAQSAMQLLRALFRKGGATTTPMATRGQQSEALPAANRDPGEEAEPRAV
jgi:hypothetical protein